MADLKWEFYLKILPQSHAYLYHFCCLKEQGKVIFKLQIAEDAIVDTFLDDAPPGTQEYIMLRQDSIQSAELKKKESPFRAKCHEIFCCPLKQVHHKENTEPE
ncbi:hypothetical protein STEG23_008283, partial [Scotinomys teguina]